MDGVIVVDLKAAPDIVVGVYEEAHPFQAPVSVLDAQELVILPVDVRLGLRVKQGAVRVVLHLAEDAVQGPDVVVGDELRVVVAVDECPGDAHVVHKVRQLPQGHQVVGAEALDRDGVDQVPGDDNEVWLGAADAVIAGVKGAPVEADGGDAAADVGVRELQNFKIFVVGPESVDTGIRVVSGRAVMLKDRVVHGPDVAPVVVGAVQDDGDACQQEDRQGHKARQPHRQPFSLEEGVGPQGRVEEDPYDEISRRQQEDGEIEDEAFKDDRARPVSHVCLSIASSRPNCRGRPDTWRYGTG